MPRILVIDDQVPVRALITRALEGKGFEVDAVDSGDSGTATFQRSHFDLAIIDPYMPGMQAPKSSRHCANSGRVSP